MYKITLFALLATAVFCLAAAAPQNPYFPTQVCKEGEATYPCGKRCEKQCNVELPGYCGGGLQCEGFTCRCKNGLERNNVNGKCVPTSQCPSS